MYEPTILSEAPFAIYQGPKAFISETLRHRLSPGVRDMSLSDSDIFSPGLFPFG